MKEVLCKNKCTGCSACMSICPKKAIEMTYDNEGFLFPKIDKSKCISCGLCKKVCPVINVKNNLSRNECYVAYSKTNNYKKERTSSGGIFPLIARFVLEENGIVIGAAFDKDNKLKHIAIEKVNDLNKLIGSKYIQSDLNNIFNYIKDNIVSRKILFVGTPCQVGGLKSFLRKDCDNLFTIDLVCHGVPSPKLFAKYVEYLEKTYEDKLINYNFRDKSTGWDTYSNLATFKTKEIKELANNNYYMKLFLSDVALRNSCYNCNFKLGNKYSDLTLGDFWGVQNNHKDMYNKNGVSAIIINSEKGKVIFDFIKNKMEYKECSLDDILKGNPCLKFSSKKHKNRDKFFNELDNIDFDKLNKKYYSKKTSFYIKVIYKIKKIVKGLIRNNEKNN